MSSHEPDTLREEIGEAAQGATEFSQKPPYSPERRLFLQLMAVGLAGVAGALISIPIIGAMISPVIDAPPDAWRDVGAVDDFKKNSTVEVTFLDPAPDPWSGLVSKNAAWLRRTPSGGFTAFTIYCQHLGCPVRWEPGPQLFLCPCHGGAYYADGNVAAGPPQRALQQYKVRINGGRVELLAGWIPVPQFPVPGTNEAPQ